MVEETPAPEIVKPLKSAKEEILERVRGAIEKRRTERESDYAYIPRQYRVEGSRNNQERLDLFADRLHDYGASVYDCDRNHIQAAIGAALGERKVQRLVTGKDFAGGWIPAGYDFAPDLEMTYEEINSYDGVVTGCALAIAETGTIVLRHADDEPRRAVSLIPDYHLCVVFAEQVVETVTQGIRKMAEMGPVPLTTIAGPSATSDIEMTRIKGVHGPRILDVILVS